MDTVTGEEFEETVILPVVEEVEEQEVVNMTFCPGWNCLLQLLLGETVLTAITLAIVLPKAVVRDDPIALFELLMDWHPDPFPPVIVVGAEEEPDSQSRRLFTCFNSRRVISMSSMTRAFKRFV